MVLRNSKHYYSICFSTIYYFQIPHLNVQWKLNFHTMGNDLNILQNISKKCKKKHILCLRYRVVVSSTSCAKANGAERKRIKANSLVDCTVHTRQIV